MNMPVPITRTRFWWGSMGRKKVVRNSLGNAGRNSVAGGNLARNIMRCLRMVKLCSLRWNRLGELGVKRVLRRWLGHARRYGSRASIAPAETVDVSAEECTGPCGGGESGRISRGPQKTAARCSSRARRSLQTARLMGRRAVTPLLVKVGVARPRLVGVAVICMSTNSCPKKKHVSRLLAGGDEVLGVTGIAENGSHVYFVARKAIVGTGRTSTIWVRWKNSQTCTCMTRRRGARRSSRRSPAAMNSTGHGYLDCVPWRLVVGTGSSCCSRAQR